MVTAELTPASPRFSERLHIFAQGALAGAVQAWQAMRNRRAVAGLLEWDDRMLRDIGLTRGDVRAAMAGPVHEDPSSRLADTCAERRAARRAMIREALQLTPPRRQMPPSRSYPFADL